MAKLQGVCLLPCLVFCLFFLCVLCDSVVSSSFPYSSPNSCPVPFGLQELGYPPTIPPARPLFATDGERIRNKQIRRGKRKNHGTGSHSGDAAARRRRPPFARRSRVVGLPLSPTGAAAVA